MMFLVSLLLLFLLVIYILEIRRMKFSVKLIVLIGVCGGMSFILNMIKFISMPQGGSITLFSMLPVLIVSFLYGRGAGLTAGILVGILKTIDGVYILHPIQFILDYIAANMCLGFANLFGNDNRLKIFLGSIIAISFSIFINILSGVVFFAEYAPVGINPLLYSIIYNISSLGIEGIMTAIVIIFVPFKRLKI